VQSFHPVNKSFHFPKTRSGTLDPYTTAWTNIKGGARVFSDLEDRAFLLGRRMAETAFTLDDNPFANLQPRLARKWLDGFVSETALHSKSGWLGHEAQHPHSDAHDLERVEKTARGSSAPGGFHATV
jgi:hypothetical protein